MFGTPRWPSLPVPQRVQINPVSDSIVVDRIRGNFRKDSMQGAGLQTIVAQVDVAASLPDHRISKPVGT